MELQGSSRIAGLGAYLPKTRVTSESIMAEINCSRFDIAEDFMATKLGIKERRVADKDMMPSDLAILASQQAMADAGVKPEDIDMILYCGIERDWQEPATAHRVQAELGCTHAACLDVSNACQGFMNGLAVADTFIASSSAENILVCTGEKYREMAEKMAEKLKKTQNVKEFNAWIGLLTVGDGGGAMVVQRKTNSSGWKFMQLTSRGQHAKLCSYKYTEDSIIGQMLMNQISMRVIKAHHQIVAQTYNKLGWQPSMVDYLYTHQAGAIPYQITCDLSGIPTDKAPTTFEFFGNLTSASIPVTMSFNRPNRGDKLLIFGAGSGISICQAGMVF